jgi:hypothetical protein
MLKQRTMPSCFSAAAFSALSAATFARYSFCSSVSSGALRSLSAHGCAARRRQTPSADTATFAAAARRAAFAARSSSVRGFLAGGGSARAHADDAPSHAIGHAIESCRNMSALRGTTRVDT